MDTGMFWQKTSDPEVRHCLWCVNKIWDQAMSLMEVWLSLMLIILIILVLQIILIHADWLINRLSYSLLDKSTGDTHVDWSTAVTQCVMLNDHRCPTDWLVHRWPTDWLIHQQVSCWQGCHASIKDQWKVWSVKMLIEIQRSIKRSIKDLSKTCHRPVKDLSKGQWDQ